MASFLSGRSDFLRQNRNILLRIQKIECGVPQGAVLSPTLFSLYINDIPTIFNKNKEYSLLFADDLVRFFIFKKAGHINAKIKSYLKQLENWLLKWRMKMQSKKCNSIIFNVNSDKSINEMIKGNLFNEVIPACEMIRFLGITFDIGLTFGKHVEEI